MGGKNANFIGPRRSARRDGSRARFGRQGVLRIQRRADESFALSLLRVFRKPIPDVFRMK